MHLEDSLRQRESCKFYRTFTDLNLFRILLLRPPTLLPADTTVQPENILLNITKSLP